MSDPTKLPLLGLGGHEGSIANAAVVETAMPLLDVVPYPVLLLAADCQVRWMNCAARALYPAGSGYCHVLTHGYNEPCNQRGEPCPKVRAEIRRGAVTMSHVHQTQTDARLFMVTAIPIVGGGVLEIHVPLDDVVARDSLTGTHCRAFFEQFVQRQLALLSRMGQGFSVLMIDVDSFKVVNDTYGHATGDDVLRQIGHAMLATIRAADSIGRLGGDEFCVYLPATAAAGAMVQAKRLLAAVRDIEVTTAGETERISVSVSIGVATAEPACFDFAAVLARADRALYEAKHNGRNRVQAAPEQAS